MHNFFKAIDARRYACLILIGVSLFVAACSSPQPQQQKASSPKKPYNENDGRYQHEKDFGPSGEVDMSHVPDAVPRYEVRTRAGNKNPYTVLGKTYHLIQDETSYKERGYASWYGFKFNGHKTSNGEIYDVYGMTGAHKTLPIPSYVKVTNLDNGKTVVVRINDRGPFHSGRIIDLSYAAAQRIGIHRAGTGRVEVEIALPTDAVSVPRKNATTTHVVSSALPSGTYLQVGAFGSVKTANDFAKTIRGRLTASVIVASAGAKNVHRVRVGPFKDTAQLQRARDQLASIKIYDAHVVYEK